MTTTFSESNSPLSRLLYDDNITILDGIIPYCPPPLGRVLALRIKFMEIQKILSCFDDEPYLKACGFEEQAGDIESVLRSLRHSVSEEKAKQIDSLLNMIHFSKMYQTYQQIIASHPELVKSQEHSADARGARESSSSDIFSDPSLFFLLSSMMNNNENIAPNNEKLKMLLDFASKGNGENKDITELLSSFLKK